MHFELEFPSQELFSRYYIQISRLALAGVFLLYWLFAWQLERIGLVFSIPAWWENIVLTYPLLSLFTQLITLGTQLFSLRVLRHLLPLIAGALLARFAIRLFIESFYDLPDASVANSLLRRLTTLKKVSRPIIRVTQETMEDARKPSLFSVGGPGLISIERGFALVTEKNGQQSRVLGPGSRFLHRFEYPQSLVDVRPQERESTEVAVTRDGIALKISFSISFHLNRGTKTPSKKIAFPFDEKSVHQAAYGQTILESGQVAHWDELVSRTATRVLNNLVAEHPLDELILPDGSGIYPHPSLKSELVSLIQAAVNNLGITVRDIRITSFQLPDPVIEQNISSWYNLREDQPSEKDSQTEEISIEDSGHAWLKAQAKYVRTITKSANEISRIKATQVGKKDIAIQIMSTLEALAIESAELAPMPPLLLERLREIRLQLEESGSVPAQ